MALWQGKSGRKTTGGRYRPSQKKRKFEISREQLFTVLGDRRVKTYRTRGANRKVRLINADHANVMDPKTNKVKKVEIKTVVDNPANPNYVQRNIMNKGAIIQTELGDAKITSRPGQDGVINAVLVKE